MGLVHSILSLFLDGAAQRTAEIFVENKEQAAQREAMSRAAALAQLAQEFQTPKVSLFDRMIDGLNRLPRPFMALGVLGLFVSAMADPIWFAERMRGMAVIPDPMWWLLGAVVSFYFGARYQAKGQEFRASLEATVARIDRLYPLDRQDTQTKTNPTAPPAQGRSTSNNAAVEEWHSTQN